MKLIITKIISITMIWLAVFGCERRVASPTSANKLSSGPIYQQVLSIGIPSPRALVIWSDGRDQLGIVHGGSWPSDKTGYRERIIWYHFNDDFSQLVQIGLEEPIDSLALRSIRQEESNIILYDFLDQSEISKKDIPPFSICELDGDSIFFWQKLGSAFGRDQYVLVVDAPETRQLPSKVKTIYEDQDSCISRTILISNEDLAIWTKTVFDVSLGDELLFVFEFKPIKSGAVVCNVFWPQ